jgi:hypothetical protein
MTKKQLLNNPEFMTLPDDAQIVFGTSNEVSECVPIPACDVEFKKEMVCIYSGPDGGTYETRHYVVLGIQELMKS